MGVWVGERFGECDWGGGLEVSRRLLGNHNHLFEGGSNEGGVFNDILLCNIHVPLHPLTQGIFLQDYRKVIEGFSPGLFLLGLKLFHICPHICFYTYFKLLGGGC